MIYFSIINSLMIAMIFLILSVIHSTNTKQQVAINFHMDFSDESNEMYD